MVRWKGRCDWQAFRIPPGECNLAATRQVVDRFDSFLNQRPFGPREALIVFLEKNKSSEDTGTDGGAV